MIKLASGSLMEGRRTMQQQSYIDRDHEVTNNQLTQDYFSDPCMYHSLYNHWKYHMRRCIFLQILERLGEVFSLFHSYNRCTQPLWFLPHQNESWPFACSPTVALLTLLISEYISEWEKDRSEHLCRDVILCFGKNYSRQPTINDLRRLLTKGEESGFLGMIRTIGSMY